MENRLKERLTGAAILVALIVMVVPELFRGQPNDVASFAGSSGEGPPLRSYTIDLSNSPTRATPLQSNPVAGSSDKAGMVVPVEPVNAPAAPAADGASPTAAAAPRPPTPVVPAAASVPAVAAAPSSAAAPVTAAPYAAAAPKATTASASARSRPAASAAARNSPESGWIVQLGLFAKRDNAERLANKAQTHGFTVSIAGADAKGLYRVYAGGMADRAAAEAYTQRLKDQGFPAAVVAAP
ncbi:MAG: SPOR domain-containing protein [Steroidobacterales bacterium]